MIDVSGPIREKALAAGADRWLAGLPALVDELAREWDLTVGRPFADGTEALVLAADLGDGGRAVLKLAVPRGDGMGSSPVRNEITALRLAAGRGCVRLLRHDAQRGALLLERLGPSLHDVGRPAAERLEILCALLLRFWRPAAEVRAELGADDDLPTGAQKARALATAITGWWAELDGPCSERTVDHALACAASRAAAHDDERAVLVHGDPHQWNVLADPRAEGGWALIDPDGLLAEPEYDLGVLMREDPLDGDPADRARLLAARTGRDAAAIWEWGVVERVSTGLLAARIGLQPVGRQMLEVADRVAGVHGP